MKLFGRVLLFFMGVILLQSLLIYFLVTNIVRVENVEDARDEILIESEAAFDTLHGVKRRLWESLLRLRGSRVFADFLENRSDFHGAVNDLVDGGAVDWIIIRNGDGTVRVLNRNYAAFPFEAYTILRTFHDYPHGGFVRGSGALYFMATFKAGAREVYLIKHLSAEFLRSVTRRMDGYLFLFGGDELLLKTASGFGFAGLKAPADPLEIRYGQQTEAGTLNIAFARIGEINGTGAPLPVTLGIGFSNTMFEDRLWMIRQLLFWVAAGTALTAGFLALLFSRNISKPVAILLDAMKRLPVEGFEARLPETTISEFQELFSQYRQMVRTLDEDRSEMERYIGEITDLKEFNETIIDSLYSGMAILNEQGLVVRVNRAFLTLFGFEGAETAGLPLRELLPGLTDREMEEGIRDAAIHRRAMFSTIRRLPGFRVYDIKAYPLSRAGGDGRNLTVLVIDDISRRTEAEEKIYQAEKLSSISLLTAGVAHEINNPLTSILSNVQMLMEDEKDDEKREAMVWVEQETRRIARIVRKLLEFAGSQRQEKSCDDVKRVLETVVHLLTFSVAKEKRIVFIKNLSPVPPVAISSDELKQIVINILKNSIQAIAGDGTVGLTVDRDKDPGFALFRFTDDGCGMKEEDISRVFDPFFTTKGEGDGTGLGLSLVYGLIEKHGGTIAVSSRLGRGTEVAVRLPFAVREGEDDEAV